MSTEQDLMKLVADYGKECISAGIAELNSSDAVKQRVADDVRKSHEALTSRLRDLLTELDAAREDAARYRWLRDECKAGDWGKVSGPYSQMLMIGAQLDKAIDAARKGEA